ncbi:MULTISPECIES: DUF7344 domain-containing protein [Saliphagus]|uniref:ArsR family transcriptional regulator n=1 Tax=Saliphagus infecundisoli TaxID=1849069 RepID=A0ABD5QIN0_9EURY|nr:MULTISPECIES: ArsR family transcriptional regulator [Saliphagus]
MSVQTGDSGTLEESEIFHLLGNDRRRAIIRYLTESEGRIDVSEVATRIAETEATGTPVPNNLYKSVYVSLQQTHLPQLEEDAIVVYDPDEKTVDRGPRFEDVLGYVDGDRGDRATALVVHLVTCVLALAVIAVTGFDVPVVGSVDPVLVAILALLVVGASSLYRLLA